MKKKLRENGTIEYGNSNKYSNLDAHTVFDFFKLNLTVKKQLINAEETIYGTQYTNGLCAFDCITSIGHGVRVLNNNYSIPINGGKLGNARVYLTNIEKIGYAGEEFRLTYELNEDMTAKTLTESFGTKLNEIVKGEPGNHFFGVSLNGGLHPIMVGVRIDDEGNVKNYFYMDNVYGSLQTNDLNDFDNFINKISNQWGGTQDNNDTFIRELIKNDNNTTPEESEVNDEEN